MTTPTLEALERALGERDVELAQAQARHAGISDVLRLISEVPHDPQTVLDTIAERATRLCAAEMAAVTLLDGELVRLSALYGLSDPQAQAAAGAMFPLPLGDAYPAGRAIIERAPVQIFDAIGDERFAFRDVAEAARLGCCLSVPMLGKDACIGSLSIMRTVPGVFAPQTVSLLQTFADQAVIAIENARLFRQTQDALLRQTATAEVLEVISASPTNVRPVFDSIVERAMALSGARIGVVTLLNQDRIELAAIRGATAGEEDEIRQQYPLAPTARTLTARAIEAGTSMQIPDLTSEPWHMFGGPRLVDTFRSVLAVPLLRDGSVIGAIGVGRDRPGVFANEVVSLIEIFASQAVIAIENVRLFNETKDALNQQTALAEVLRVISSSVADTTPVFEKIIDSCQRLFQACQIAIPLLREDGLLHLGAYRGSMFERLEHIWPMKFEHAPAAQAVRAGRAMHYPEVNASNSDAPGLREGYQALGAHSLVIAPLVHQGRCIGTIDLARQPPRPFTGQEIALLTTFADQAVIAIENSRLFRETQEALARQTATADVLKVIASSPTSVWPVFETIAERAAALCGGALGLSFQYDGALLHLVGVSGASPMEERALRSAFPGEPDQRTVASRAVLARGPVQVFDLHADSAHGYRSVVLAAGVRAALAVPMLREDEVVGVISVGRLEPSTFPEPLIKLLQTFADQAVIAIENVRLFNETKEALEQQTATAEVLQVIAASVDDAAPVFGRILDGCERLVAADQHAIMLVEGDLVCAAAIRGPHAHVARELYPYPVTESPLESIFRDRKALYVADARSVIDHIPIVRRAYERFGNYSFVSAPLILEGRPVGVLNASRIPPRPFADKEIALLQTFADQAVIAIENARLFRETREALEQQTATAEVLRVISSSVADTAPVFEKILDSCEQLFATDSLGIFVVGDDDMMHMAAVRGVESAQVAATYPARLSETVGYAAIRARRAIHIPDVAADYHNLPAAARALCDKVGNFSMILAPMLWEGRGIGVIGARRTPPKPFTDREISLLSTFADQAVIAIQNSRLFNETKEALEQQTATAEVLRVISSSVADTAPVFEKILDSCERLFGSTHVGLYLLDENNVLHGGLHRGAGAEALNKAIAAAGGLPLEETVSYPAIRDQRAVHYPDWSLIADDNPWHRAYYDALGNLSAVVAPMLWEGRGIGTIGVIRAGTERRPFSDKEIALISTFADQAVIAIQNARLFNDTKEALEQQTATAEVLKVIGSSVEDTAPVFDKIIDSCRHLFGTEQIVIFMEQEDGQVVLGAHRGPVSPVLEDMFPRPARDSVHGVATRAGRTVHYADVSKVAGRPTDMQEVYERTGNHSVVIAPMLWEGRGIGSVVVGRYPPRPFTDKEIALLTTFADQAVIAIQNSRLFHETREALERQIATAEILKVISSSPTDLQPVFDAIADRALALCRADVASVNLFDGELMDSAAVRGLSPAQEATLRALLPMKPDRSIISARAILEGVPVQVADLFDDPEFSPLSPIRDAGFRSGLAVPLFKDGQCIGAIVVMRRVTGAFPDKLVQLFQTFADQAVIAIQNVRLFHEIADKSHQLERANQHKSEFLANMSHELRTPLNAVIGFSEVLIERMFGDLNEKQADYLNDIHTSGKHLLSLINDILDLSKIEAGRMELEIEDFDIAAALRNTLTLVRERAERHGIALSLDAEPMPGSFRADQRKLKQIMLNLLSNAVKFTPDGGRIDVRATVVDDRIEVAVHDTGIGIAEDDQEAIFQEFRQVGGHYTNKQEGTGLGLALTRRFVELHGGTLRVASTLGRGSTFTFTLPRQP